MASSSSDGESGLDSTQLFSINNRTGMSFPSPSERQAGILWFSVTTLAVGVSLAVFGLLIWSLGLLVNLLSSVLLPLAMAAIIAYLLDPVVDWLEHKQVPRTRAIILVFFVAVMLFLILLATVIPQLLVETSQLIDQIPAYAEQLKERLGTWLESSRLGKQAKEAWDEGIGTDAQNWATTALPVVSAWLMDQLGKVASWGGLLAGFALVPVYVFYFLSEKQGIVGQWTDYLPLKESKLKDEVVFVLNEINNCLIVFFRGQVLVAMCVGGMLTVGFMAVGLNYAILLGIVAGALSIVPYLGVMLSIIPALALAAIQFGDIWHPLAIVGVFSLAQMAEGLVISPKIIGDRVGLHPLTIIVAVMIGTTLIGGILGGVLAIPLTAALRTLMFRYVWKKRETKQAVKSESSAQKHDAAQV